MLFICGGAFAGIEKIVERRTGTRGVGFGADIRKPEDKDLGAIFAEVLPEDLTKYGLIPEFIGRLPVMGAVRSLEREALMRILVEPRNALVRQYQKMFRFENVDLAFDPDALEAIADEAIKRASGARGLRAVLEEVLLDIMYDLPGRRTSRRWVIDRGAVLRNVNPTLVPRAEGATPAPGAPADCCERPPVDYGRGPRPSRHPDQLRVQARAGRVHGLSLQSMQHVASAMGDPQRCYRVIHVTGTNGKGSTVRVTTRLLQAMGLRVGAYTSPHLVAPTERISVDSEPMDSEAFGAAIGDVARFTDHLQMRATWFETVTAAALQHFADVAVDVAVVEVGMLGRFDATNVVDAEVAVVTNVGRDHTDGVGDWRLAVAREKGRHREARIDDRLRRDRRPAARRVPSRAECGDARARPRLRDRRPGASRWAVGWPTSSHPTGATPTRWWHCTAGISWTTPLWPWPPPRPSSERACPTTSWTRPWPV